MLADDTATRQDDRVQDTQTAKTQTVRAPIVAVGTTATPTVDHAVGRPTANPATAKVLIAPAETTATATGGLVPVRATAKHLTAKAETVIVAYPVAVSQTGNARDQQTARQVDVKDQTVYAEATATKWANNALAHLNLADAEAQAATVSGVTVKLFHAVILAKAVRAIVEEQTVQTHVTTIVIRVLNVQQNAQAGSRQFREL